MFKLIYRDGAPENAGHYEVFDKTTGTALAVGTLVIVSNGVASAYEDGSNATPYGVVAVNAAADEDEVTVLKITKDMIFRTKNETGASFPSSNIRRGSTFGLRATGIDLMNSQAQNGFEITEVVSVFGDNEEGYALPGSVVDGRFVYPE